MRYRRSTYHLTAFLLFWVGTFFIIPSHSSAQAKPVERDTDKDGKIDQIAYVDKRGNLIRLTIDSNADGVFDKTQFYQDGKIVRIESDRDFDGKVDARDLFENEKRVRHERLSADDRIQQIIVFDEQERPLTMERDTTADGRFDTRYEFVEGHVARSTRDTDADDKINVWQTYRNDLPVEQKTDGDGDGRIERVVLFDEKGQPHLSRHDMDANGTFETVRHYVAGEITRQEKDSNGDGAFDIVLTFENAEPALQKRDTNHDGRFDVTTWYASGQPHKEEKDTNFDDTADVFITFDKDSQPLKIQEDTRYTGRIDRIRHFKKGIVSEVIADGDGDGFLESHSYFKDGKISTQTQDENKDTRADVTIFFNAKEEKVRVESDTDYSGRVDAWEYFTDQVLVRAERDSNNDGQVDLKVYYRDAERQRMIQDRDHDGQFETTQWFDRPPWSMVMEVDTDVNGTPEGIYSYQDGVLREKLVDENADGGFDLKEVYNEDGKLIRSEEEPDDEGRFRLVWVYDDKETAIRAEKDQDGDGRPDVWYTYKDNRLAMVAEDTNADGKPDLWEEYDESEALVKRSKDYNNDGIPDYTESASGN